MSHGILYACIVRDETLLVQAKLCVDDTVLDAARELLNRPATLGWDSFKPSWSRNQPQGLRLHVYQQRINDEPRLWIFCCVYQSTLRKRQAQAFLEKIATLTEIFRETSESWIQGDHLACDDMFQPILKQQMLAADSLEDVNLSQHILQCNRTVINEFKLRKERDDHEKKEQEAAMLRQMEEMNRMLQCGHVTHAASPSKSFSSYETSHTFDSSFTSYEAADDGTRALDSDETSNSAEESQDDCISPPRLTKKQLDGGIQDLMEEALLHIEMEARRRKETCSSDDDGIHLDRVATIAAIGMVGVLIAVLFTSRSRSSES